MGAFDEIIRQAMDARNRAVQAAQQAEQDRRRRRQENDHYVTGGVNWDGYGLEPLIKMVADRANPAQLDALAGEWSRHGQSVVRASEDLSRSLNTLMQYWSGTAADTALQKVTTNAAWITELGGTAQEMSAPIQDASGALRSAQSTMPGMPKNNWLASAGGGAAVGFAVGGPVGAAFGAAIGGLASAFGFGSSKKKLKRKAVQTMQRYETALLGVDSTTPQFGQPADGVNPGGGPAGNPDPGIGTPGGAAPAPGANDPGPRPVPPASGPVHGIPQTTDPAFAGGPEGRWQSITGLGPSASGGGGLPPSTGPTAGGPVNTAPGLVGGGRLPGTGLGPIGAGRGGLPGSARGGVGRSGVIGGGTGRGTPGSGRGGIGRGGVIGGGNGRGGVGAGRGAGGAFGPGSGRGTNGRGASIGRSGNAYGRAAEEAAGRGRGSAGNGYGAGAGRNGDKEYRGRGRFSRSGEINGRGGGYGSGAPGSRADEEDDGEHRRRVPIEDDPFSTDLKAAPPVIGL
ncbi:MAG TPA: WXG100 family type VII secretion target [Actinophytocola sp.]|uniref:WXG100 family type VII secretion target n=1 Tax=Actinophytocola sp. TaxID=1872138 RepID=UPI002F92AE6B